jgi:hypothetical protein
LSDRSDFRLPSCENDLHAAVAAWVLGFIDVQDLPRVATEALSRGTDGLALRQLAGLTPVEIDEATNLFSRALHELGFPIPDKRRAALQYAARVSSLIVAREITPYHGAKSLWRASLAVGDRSFHELDPFIYAASEYEDRPEDRALFEASILEEAKRFASSAT